MVLNKIFSKAIVLSAMISLLGSVSVFAAVKGEITSDSINVRAGASTDTAVVGSLNSGKQINIIEKSGEWYKISYDGITAFVSSQFVNVNSIDAVINGNDVNIRSTANTDGDIVATVKAGDPVSVLSKEGDWYKLSYNGGQAYVNKAYVDGSLIELAGEKGSGASQAQAVSNMYGLVVCDGGLNIRTEATKDSQVVELLPNGEVVDVIGAGDKWVKIKTPSGKVGFASSDYLSVRSGEKPSRSNSSKGDQVIEYAKQFLGTPYVYGGTNLKSGVDCSGFVYSVYKNFGINLNRSSSGMVSNGVKVEKSQLIAGDLILFDTTGANNGGISHVGIYMGNGQYIHSSSGKVKGVIISQLNDDYGLRTYVTARRVLR